MRSDQTCLNSFRLPSQFANTVNIKTIGGSPTFEPDHQITEINLTKTSITRLLPQIMPKSSQRKSARLPKPSQKCKTRSVSPSSSKPTKKRAPPAKFINPSEVMMLEESEGEDDLPEPTPVPFPLKDVSSVEFTVDK